MVGGYGEFELKGGANDLKLKRGEEKLMTIPFDGAKVDLFFTAVDFGAVEAVVAPKKKAPVSSSNELPPMPSKEEVEAQFLEVAVCPSYKHIHSFIYLVVSMVHSLFFFAHSSCYLFLLTSLEKYEFEARIYF